MSNEENGKPSSKKDRYWSVMLVGDRGRVIPFRHFKGIALGVCCVSFLLLVAFIVMSILYIGQGRTLASLENELKNAQFRNSKLRDEKDLYLTKLTLTQKQEKAAVDAPKSPVPAKPAQTVPLEDKSSAKAPAEAKSAAPAVKKEAPAKPKPPAPEVQWKADIRRFSVSYDAKSEVLKAQFRVYNASKPKKRLSGRSVVVFKVQDDPPVKWVPVPRVQLSSGEPSGKRGQSFRVKNYLTMKFRAYRQKTPVLFNTATVYIFGKDGKMLSSKDFAFKIDTPPPPPPKKEPKPAPPSPKEEPKPAPPPPKEEPKPDPPAVKEKPAAIPSTPKAVTPTGETVPAAPEGQQPGGSAATDPVPAEEQLPVTNQPPAQPIQEPEVKEPSDIEDTPPPSEPAAGASDTPIQTETPSGAENIDTAPQPKVEGETR